MSRNTLIVILLGSLAGALRSQPVLPVAIDRAVPSPQPPLAMVAQAMGRGATVEEARSRELLAFIRDNLASKTVCEAPPRPSLLSQR